MGKLKVDHRLRAGLGGCITAFQELADKYELAAVVIATKKWRRIGAGGGLDQSQDVLPITTGCWPARSTGNRYPGTDSQNHTVAAAAAGPETRYSGKTVGPPTNRRWPPRSYRLCGIKMMIAENYRYSEEFNLIRKLLAEKKIGEPSFIHHHVLFPANGERYLAATEWQHPRIGDLWMRHP